MIKKVIVAASCMLMLLSVGCKKEERDVEPQKKARESLTVHCSPYRVVLGSDLVAELTALANCELSFICYPNSTVQSQSPRFINPANSSFYGFQNSASISTADQLTILQAGQNYATANKPAGYDINYIEFKASYLTHPFTDWFNVYVVVTYQMCL